MKLNVIIKIVNYSLSCSIARYKLKGIIGFCLFFLTVCYQIFAFDTGTHNINYFKGISQIKRQDGHYDYYIETSGKRLLLNSAINNIDNSNIKLSPLGKPAYKINYIVGHNRNNWLTNVPVFDSLKLIIPNNQISISIKSGQLSYDFSKCDNDNSNISKSIKMLCDSLNNNSFCTKYKSTGKNTIQSLSLDSSLINPDEILFSSFIPANKTDICEKIRSDKNHNIYLTGYTNSSDFPVTDTAFQKDNLSAENSYPSVFVAKYSADFKPVFVTYISGYWDDYAKDMKIADDSSIFITGYTASMNTFPISTGVYDSTYNGGYDAFILQLSPQGDSLIHSTLLGGTKDDYAMSLILDSLNNPIVTGYTAEESDFPVTYSAIQKNNRGKNDIFVSKLSADFSQLIASTLLGGTEEDFAQDIILNHKNQIIITGSTSSANFPLTPNAFQSSFADTISSSRSDAFLVILSNNCDKLIYSSYIGGAGRDCAYSESVDTNDNIYITGFTESYNFPISSKAFQSTYHDAKYQGGSGDIFASKFSADGKTLLYSTFIGGSSTDRAWAADLDKHNNLYLTGTTSSVDYPTTKNATDSTYNDDSSSSGHSSDAFITVLDSTGSRLAFSTYLGGNKADVGKSLQVIKDSLLLIAGITNSNNFPFTQKIYSSKNVDSNYGDCFFAKIQILPYYTKLRLALSADTAICNGDSVVLHSEVTGSYGQLKYEWTPKLFLSSDTVSNPTANPIYSTKYYLTVTDSLMRSVKDSVTITVKNLPDGQITGAKTSNINTLQKYSFPYQSDYKYLWKAIGGTISGADTLNNVSIIWTDSLRASIYLEVQNSANCSSIIVFDVMIGHNYAIKLNRNGQDTICNSESLILDAGNYASYLWNDGKTTRFDTVGSPGIYWVTVTDVNGFHGFSDTLSLTVLPAPTKPLIKYYNGLLQCLSYAESYQWYKNGTAIPDAIQRTYKPQHIGTYWVEIGISSTSCRTKSDSLDIEFVGIKDYETIITKSYPNPTSGTFYISSNFVPPLQQIKIFNSLGFELDKSSYIYSLSSDNIIHFDLNNSPNGIYFVNITDYTSAQQIFKISLIK